MEIKNHDICSCKGVTVQTTLCNLPQGSPQFCLLSSPAWLQTQEGFSSLCLLRPLCSLFSRFSYFLIDLFSICLSAPPLRGPVSFPQPAWDARWDKRHLPQTRAHTQVGRCPWFSGFFTQREEFSQGLTLLLCALIPPLSHLHTHAHACRSINMGEKHFIFCLFSFFFCPLCSQTQPLQLSWVCVRCDVGLLQDFFPLLLAWVGLFKSFPSVRSSVRQIYCTMPCLVFCCSIVHTGNTASMKGEFRERWWQVVLHLPWLYDTSNLYVENWCFFTAVLLTSVKHKWSKTNFCLSEWLRGASYS